MNSSNQIRQVIENSHLFSGLAPRLMDAIAASATKRTLGTKELLFQKGDRADALWGVLSGRILIEVRADDGKEMVLDEFRAGDVFGEVGVLDFGPRRVGATAACESELFRIERAHFLEHLHANPELCFRVFSLLCSHLRDTTETLEDTALYKLPGRLAKRLILMAKKANGESGGALLNIAQSELARMMGVHREAVNRQLREWEKSGWISIQRQRIEILEEKWLADLAVPGQAGDHRTWGIESIYRPTPAIAPVQRAPQAGPKQAERRSVGILAVDCADYAGLLATDSENTIKWIKAGLAAIDEAIRTHGGRVIWSAGDRTLAEFPDGAAAVDAALDIQRNTGDKNARTAGQSVPIFRIGIHAGGILDSDGRIFGEPVNIAIRLTGIPGSGDICLSGEVRDALEETEGLDLQYLGSHELKNVARPVRVFSVRKVPWLKRVALRAESLIPRRFRLAAVTAAALVAAGGVWIGGNWVARRDAPPAGSPVSLAVLPFTTNGDPTLDYLAQGIPDEVRASLNRIPVMRVIGRESSGHFSDHATSPEEIARIGEELNVAYLVEGSVSKTGNRLNIDAQLIEVENGFQLWSESFNRPTDDVFEIQHEITSAVTDEFKVKLLGAVSNKKAANPEAYALYLRGRYFQNLADLQNMTKAFAAYKQALAIDSNYAPAWIGLAMHYQYLEGNSMIPREEGYLLALEATEKALAADDQLALAWCSLGYIRMKYEWNWEGARAAIEKGLDLDSNLSNCVGVAASLAWTLGQSSKHVRLREKAVELEPLSLVDLSGLGLAYVDHARPDDALRIFEQILAINPDYPWIHEKIGRAHLRQGHADKALMEFNKYPDNDQNFLNKLRALVALGRDSEAQAKADAFLAEAVGIDPFWTAAFYSWLGDNDEAFKWLETAFQEREPSLRTILTNSYLTNLQTDPRYPVFLGKMDLLEAWKSMSP